ncbi:MAG: HAMP domain-containing sensor histidine kinase [Acidimicrobiales bacterium]
MTGVRGRVVLTVLVVSAVLYSLLATVGFLQLAHSGRDATRERIGEVLDQLEASVRAGGTTVRLTTPDGVEAIVASDPSEGDAGSGEILVRRDVTVRGSVVRLEGRASEAPLSDNLRRLHRGLWIAVPIAVLLTAGAAGAAMRRALRPVSEITALAATIGPSDTTTRVPVPDTDDEVAHLATTVNGMLDRIAEGRLAQHRFTSDAAHELRTPLMAMQGELELARRHPSTVDDGFVVRLEREAARLAERVDDLVLLSSLDERPPLRLEPFDLRELVVHEAGDVDVSGGAMWVQADQRLVARAVRNLVANAHRHASAHVSVVIETEGGDRVWLHVDDDGPGIPVDGRDAVFERFARLDEGRSSDRGGAGLGLAIVAGVAQAHGGGVAAGDSPAGGARVSIWLPAHSPSA